MRVGVLVVLLVLALGVAEGRRQKEQLPKILTNIGKGITNAANGVANAVKGAAKAVGTAVTEAKTALVGAPGPNAKPWPGPGPKPVCLFIHGTGIDVFPTRVVASYPDYWGKTITTNVAPACDAKFLQTDEMNYGWDDQQLWTAICSNIKSLNARYVITHSNSNTGLAAALAKNVSGCADRIYTGGATVGATQFLWISIQGPFQGSPAADLCVKDCATWSLNPLTGVIHITCHCHNKKTVPSDTKLTTGYKSSVAGLSGGWGPVSAQHAKAWAIMCGTDPGSTSLLHLDGALVVLAPKANWGGAKTDGMVSLPSCQAGLSASVVASFQAVPTSKNYLLAANHGAGTMRDGDGNAADKQPVTWLVNMLNDGTILLTKK